jgi:hypothetical protein
VIGPSSSGEEGGRRVRAERVGALWVTGEVLMALERAAVAALRFFGAGGVSGSSSGRAVTRLGLGFVATRLRFKLRGGFGMARWTHRRSAKDGVVNEVETPARAEYYIRPINQYAFALAS